MTTPGPPYAAAPPPPPRPGGAKPRPRKRWFAVGVLLLVAAVAVFVVGLVQTVSGASRTDAVVDATQTAVDVGVEAGERRMLFTPQSLPPTTCRLADAEGREIAVETSSIETTVTADGRTWLGVGTFTSATAEISVDCTGSQEGVPVRIGSPLGGAFAVGLVVTLLMPLLLGLAGVVVLVVTTVLWFTRAPRSAPPAPPWPPAPAG